MGLMVKVIESKKTEADKFFKEVAELQNDKEIVDYLCIPIYEDGSFDYFHTSMKFSNMIGILEMAKYFILDEWNNEQ